MSNDYYSQENRIKRRISSLEDKLGNWEIPYGKSNPNYYCSCCKKSLPEISIDGHGKGCSISGILNEIKYLKRKLNSLTKLSSSF